jgi:hypothetical protein
MISPNLFQEEPNIRAGRSQFREAGPPLGTLALNICLVRIPRDLGASIGRGLGIYPSAFPDTANA